MLRARLLLIAALLAIPGAASAANTPCSGSKGGISHCEGETFVCRDGSASGSRKSCPAVFGGSSASPAQALRARPDSVDTQGCACSQNTYCTGPRGGRYCLTSTGSKRYLRK
ncbi:hypothetical protein BRI6_1286 [plant metagenome]|uniref:Uncharacterized protein n=1 Tax=plant metagenome TaxID=1297885 RepID=A0A484VGG1_9ZZZZ